MLLHGWVYLYMIFETWNAHILSFLMTSETAKQTIIAGNKTRQSLKSEVKLKTLNPQIVAL